MKPSSKKRDQKLSKKRPKVQVGYEDDEEQGAQELEYEYEREDNPKKSV